MPSYQQTHPWLRFNVDLTKANVALWLLLGEVRSKIEHIKGVPLRPATAQELHIIYLAKGIHATTAIEGNTLSVEQVEEQLKGTLKLPPSREYLQRETANIAKACGVVLNELVNKTRERRFTADTILEYNRLVLDGLDLGEEVVPGAYRKHSVGVFRYRAPPASECPELIERLCDWLNGHDFDNEALGFSSCVVKAVVAHLYMAWIHPFGDGNGRTARLLEFHVLVAAGCPSPTAHLLSNHYNLTRGEYYRQLDRASQSGGDIGPFLLYAVQGLVDQLREQIGRIREQQWDEIWRNYVHEVLSGETPAVARQRQLVLDLSARRKSQWVGREEIPAISGRLATAYGGRTDKTLSRDLNALEEKKLVRVDGKRIKANRELILAFLPAAAGDAQISRSSSETETHQTGTS
jgi:Fic family protein